MLSPEKCRDRAAECLTASRQSARYSPWSTHRPRLAIEVRNQASRPSRSSHPFCEARAGPFPRADPAWPAALRAFMIATAIAGNAVLYATVVMLGGVMGASQSGRRANAM